MKTIPRPQLTRLTRALASCSLLTLAPGIAWPQALPTGMNVAVGSAQVATRGNAMTVTNSAGAVLNWQTFNIGNGASVRFEQPSASSMVLNKVLGHDPSNIFGSLTSNGQVWLFNPNGVFFGPNARIDVAGLVASTLRLNDSDWVAGRYVFTGDANGSASVVNHGELATSFGGRVALIGNSVANHGLIEAPGGQVVLAAGRSVELVDTGAPNLGVRVTADAGEALNLGTLRAAGGRIDIHAAAVNQMGIVRADSLAQGDGGQVLVQASGRTTIGAGSVTSASSTGGAGGTVHVFGDEIGLLGDARVEARGGNAGGEVLAGGGWQGRDARYPNARALYMSPQASISVDALSSGNGGNLVLWSNEATRAYGHLSGRGGATGGDGGHIETSGGWLDARPATLDVSAAAGKSGHWLLDPFNYVVSDEVSNSNVNLVSFAATGDNASLSSSTLTSALNAGTAVTISSAGAGTQPGNVQFSAATLNVTAANPGSLTVIADGTLTLSSSSITSSSGAMPVTLRSAGAMTLTNTSVNARGGAINVRAPDLTLTNSTLTSHAAGDAIVIAGPNDTAMNSFNSSGASPLVTSAGRWIAFLNGTIGQFSPGTFDYAFRRVGGTFGSWAGDSGNGFVYSGASLLTLGGNAVSRAYDGGTSAALNNVTASTGIAGITATLKAGVTGVFLTKNVATNKPVGFSQAEPFNVIDVQGKPVFGFTVPNLSANITAAPLLVGGLSTPVSQTYTATPNAIINGTPSISPLGGDTVALGGTLAAFFSNFNAGSNRTIALSGLSLSGADAANYTLQYPPLASTITPAPLTLHGMTGTNKQYDGTTTASFTGSPSALGAALQFDVVGVAGTPSASFVDKNAGTAKPIIVSGLSLTGPVAGNYALQPVQLSANITPAPLLVGGLTGANKVYDGNTSITLSGTPTVSPLAGDVVSVSGPVTGAFADKNVGNSKPITVTGVTLSGSAAGNYTAQAPTTLVANITPLDVTIGGLTGASKVYDGTTAIALSGNATLSNAVAGDNVALAGSLAGTFADKNVGTNKSITVGGASLTGTDASNYRLVQPTGVTGSITRRDLSVSGLSVANKIYDGTTVATLSGTPTLNALAGDSVSLSGTASVVFADKNVGTGKAVSLSGLTLGGLDAGNYNLLPSGGLTANITPRALTVSGLTAQSKTYDGTTVAQLGGTPTFNALAGDNVTASGSNLVGSFADKNVGTNKTVTLSGLVLGGTDAGNYSLQPASGLTASITARSLALGGVTFNSTKVYDGTDNATFTGTPTVSALAGDNVTLSGTLAARLSDKNVGNGRTISLSGLSVSGADAGNYAFSAGTSTTVSITAATLTYTANAATRLVGEAIGTLSGTVTGFVPGESLSTATSGTATFTTTATSASPAGSYAINGSGLTINNSNYVPAQAASNASALTIQAPPPEPSPVTPQPAQEVARVATAIVLPTPTSDNSSSGMADLSATEGSGASSTASRGPAARKEDFGTVRLASLSPDAIQQLLASRDRYKKEAFAESIARLSVNPALADMRPCTNLREAQDGTCLVTEELKKQWAEQKAKAAPPAVAAAPAPAPAAAPGATPRPAPAVTPAGPAVTAAAAAAAERRRVRQAALPQIERKVALVIGVDSYADGAIPPLANSVKDARAMAGVLETEMGYETIVLENPSRAAVVGALNRLALDTSVLDSVAIYYAGHGELIEATKLGYWQLADADAKKPETWLSNSDIGRLVGRIPASQVALISDSCYSGSLVSEERIRASASAVDPIAVLTRKTVVVMSSGGNEPVFDAGKNGHSPFAWSLMNTLKQVNNWRPGGQIFERVRFAVARELPQRPQYGASSAAGHQAGGDYLFEQRVLEGR